GPDVRLRAAAPGGLTQPASTDPTRFNDRHVVARTFSELVQDSGQALSLLGEVARRDRHDNDPGNRKAVPDRQLSKVEVFADNYSVVGDRDGGEIPIRRAAGRHRHHKEIVPSVAKRLDGRPRTAFIDQKTHAYSAACLACSRR